MSTNQNRIHDQIVDLITKAHTSSDTMEAKIQCLQEATELLLYHTAGNERLDEFLETFLSMHIVVSALTSSRLSVSRALGTRVVAWKYW